MLPSGKPWNSSRQTFSARSYGIACPHCDYQITFELGWMLDWGIDPAIIPKVCIRCPACRARLDVTPKEARALLSDSPQA